MTLVKELLLMVLAVAAACIKNATSSKANNNVRLVTIDEIAKYSGNQQDDNSDNNIGDGNSNNNNMLWLSILGEVYDVTSGRDYYGNGPKGYGVFAGRDCSVAYVTGQFNLEECKKYPTSILKDKQLQSLIKWKKFYANHDTYKFVGYLIDEKFYDKHGKPTNELVRITERTVE